jgi:hypothetical protein
MRDTSDRPAAPNYTSACVVMFGVNLVWVLLLLWAIWGLVAVALIGWGLSRLIDHVAQARS